MINSIAFGKYIVEHNDSIMKSTVTYEGKVLKIFNGSETSWSDAERWASDEMYKDLYA